MKVNSELLIWAALQIFGKKPWNKKPWNADKQPLHKIQWNVPNENALWHSEEIISVSFSEDLISLLVYAREWAT
jgi:hypothetical protein